MVKPAAIAASVFGIAAAGAYHLPFPWVGLILAARFRGVGQNDNRPATIPGVRVVLEFVGQWTRFVGPKQRHSGAPALKSNLLVKF